MSVRESAPARGKGPGRPRLPILFAGLAILWAVGWYSWSGGWGLMATAGVCVALAFGLPRSLSNTARSMVWSGVLLIVVCLSANMERIVPPEAGVDLLRLYQYDRIVTVALALALTSLFFAPSTGTWTMVVAGSLPMLMYALAQNSGLGFRPWTALAVWGGLGLFLLAGLVQRTTRWRSAGIVPPGGGEWGTRILSALVALALAYALAFPVAMSARFVRTWLMDSLYKPLSNTSSSRDSWLSLRAPPGGSAGDIRPLLSIRADSAPGYLREFVFLRYAGGQWMPRPSGEATADSPVEESGSEDGWRVYPLVPGGDGPGEVWTVRMLAPSQMAGFCLPGVARALLLAEPRPPVADADGVVAPEEGQLPARFAIRVESAAKEDAYPGPDPDGNPDYLSIPPALTNAVAAWVADCPGLLDADGPEAAMNTIVRYFHDRFEYALDPLPGGGEPLNVFMAVRKGHCTLFASAATLMLRRQGIPARMVAGYFCNERHPLTGQWVARERNGHAWCEAWDARVGRWRQVEATPPDGWPDDFNPPGRLRLAIEGLGAAWRAFVERIRTLNPLVAVAEAGLWMYLFLRNLLKTPGGWLLLMTGLGWAAWALHRRRQKILRLDPEARLRAKLVQAMMRLERKSTAVALRRRSDEPWTNWRQRVAPQLPSSVVGQLDRLLGQYQDLRYHAKLDAAAACDWMVEARGQQRVNHRSAKRYSGD